MNTVVVLYASSRGSTRRVVARLAEWAQFSFDRFDVKQVADPGRLSRYRTFLFFSPTYGNEELQPDMERFLLDFTLDLSEKRYAVCGLGNYYGFDTVFGAVRIIRHHLDALRGRELIDPLSLDSLPKKDWKAFAAWCGRLNDALRDAHE